MVKEWQKPFEYAIDFVDAPVFSAPCPVLNASADITKTFPH